MVTSLVLIILVEWVLLFVWFMPKYCFLLFLKRILISTEISRIKERIGYIHDQSLFAERWRI